MSIATSSWISSLPQIQGSYRYQAKISHMTWFQVGGPAEVLFRPESLEEFQYFLQHRPKNVPITVLGVGSNTLIRDGGIEGIVIRLGRAFTAIRHEGNLLYTGAGNLNYNVCLYSAQHDLGGIEFLCGVPGTIGGALAMNAGCYGSDTASVLKYAEALDSDGQLHTLYPRDIGYIYRGHTLPEGMIFTKAVFACKRKTGKLIQDRIEEIMMEREISQPLRTKTCGSTFKNPRGHKAWKLIDQAGCRGLQKGGAKISEKHCNFILNQGDATAQDIEGLIELVREKVLEASGILLEREIQIIGKPAR